MARGASWPKRVRVEYRGLPYWFDLVTCRRGLVNSQIQGGVNSLESLADACGISRSTTSRFFSGRRTSLEVALRILDALGLKFEDVATPIEDDSDQSQGEGSPRTDPKPVPCPSPRNLSLRLDGGFAQ
jgi:hypothetical protein